MAETLKARGFTTGGFVGGVHARSKWGIAQGFDTYFDDFDLTKYQVVSLGAIQRPGNEVADKALAWLDTAGGSRFFAWVHLYDAHSPYEPPEPFDPLPRRPYAGEIAFVDSQVGRLLAFLDSTISRRTIVVVIGDHGESLGDHGESTHGFFVYESVTARAADDPGALRPHSRPARRGRRCAAWTCMPTALELLGIRAGDILKARACVR